MRPRVSSVLVLGLLALVLVGCDTTPPRFRVPLDVGFVVGGQIEASDAEGDEEAYTWDIPRRLTWLATDDDQACPVTYDLELIYAGAEPGLLLENDRRTQFDLLTNDYDGSFGGGSGATAGWNVIAQDCAGNAAESAYRGGTRVWQEDGFSPFGPRYEPTIEWSGTWATQTGAWTSGGQQRYTSASGATVRFTWDHYHEGQHIGLVMAMGPGRGTAAVLVDDVLVGTVDTSAAANSNRRVVFDQRMPAGSHSLTILNLATSGHPRIDVDAFLL